MVRDQLERTLKYPVNSIVSYEWIGNSQFNTPKFNGQTVSVTLPASITYAEFWVKVQIRTDPYKLVHAPLGYPVQIATLVVGTYTPTWVCCFIVGLNSTWDPCGPKHGYNSRCWVTQETSVSLDERINFWILGTGLQAVEYVIGYKPSIGCSFIC